jgi:hypothetical protein
VHRTPPLWSVFLRVHGIKTRGMKDRNTDLTIREHCISKKNGCQSTKFTSTGDEKMAGFWISFFFHSDHFVPLGCHISEVNLHSGGDCG